MIHCYSEFRAYALIRQYLIKKIPITKFIYKRARKAIVICIITMGVSKHLKAWILSNSLFIKVAVNCSLNRTCFRGGILR